MDLLCIDLGSYSIKYLKGRIERRIFEVLDYGDIVLGEVMDELDDDATILDAQIIVLKSLFEEKGPDTKVIFQMPYYLSTSRYFNLPVVNKRKAEMMLPFQLEDNLPYALSETHFCFSLHKDRNHTKAKIHISKISEFDSFYNLLVSNNILPATLSTEPALIQSALETECPSGTFMILDIGHETTKSYFIYNHQLVSSHVSHIAGHTINDVISKMYNISYEEASEYKHQNCFFLTESQLQEVNQEQREFALIMKKAMEPLVAEIKRWDLGHRVKYGAHVNRVYLTGGTTKIKNLDNFLAEEVSLPIERLNHFPTMQLDENAEDDYSIFQMIKFHATSEISKTPPSNFLSGKYTSDFSQNIPMHSTAFLFTRVMIVVLLISSFLMAERFLFLEKEDSKVLRTANSVIKNPELGIDQKESRYLKSDPDKLFKILSKQASSLEEQVNSLKTAGSTDASMAFIRLSQLLSNNPVVSLKEFASSEGKVKGTFESLSIEEIVKFSKYINKLSLTNLKTNLNESSRELEISYEEDQE